LFGALVMGARTVGLTTDESSLFDQVNRYTAKNVRGQNRIDVASRRKISRATLADKCVDVIVKNFEHHPVHENIPASSMREITSRLSIDLDAKIAAEFVFDENYWKGRCLQQVVQRSCQINQHGLSWKQLFFETHLQQCFEEIDSTTEHEFSCVLLSSAHAYQDYIFTLQIQQLLGHPDMESICKALPNLTRLDITYGVKKIGMKYNRMLFGMKISDANCLAKSIVSCLNLTSIVLQSNLIDDDLLRMLMTGLIKNSQITHLDFAHNKITNHGVRLLSKLLGTTSVLTSLNLSDNQIHAEGGRYLGRALKVNESLIDLNLRLNRLVDDGGRMLLEGLCFTSKIAHLNLSGNSLARMSTLALVEVLTKEDSSLRSIDLSCNELTDEDLDSLARAVQGNKILTSMDLRMNRTRKGNADVHSRIHNILQDNELLAHDVMEKN